MRYTMLKFIFLSAVLSTQPVLLSDQALAQMKGVWATGEEYCPRSRDDYERIEGNYNAIEVLDRYIGFVGGEGLNCTFEGGDTTDPSYWTMKARCGEEGEDEAALEQVDLRLKSGILEFKRSDSVARYAIRCTVQWD